ncbi:MAG: beta-ketoacyl-ACP synthase II [Blastocatellia bacterium]|nr:beta-ketoacyl-ACP synthase II [Blastocatellia bacterium]
MKHRVVITGVGMVSPVGNTAEESWAALLRGQTGMDRITHFDPSEYSVRIAAEVKNFDPAAFIEKKEIKKMDPFIHYAVAAAQEALDASGLKITEENAERIGTFVGSALGGFTIIEREQTKLFNGGPDRISPFFIPSSIINLATGQISIRFGSKGPNSATATACASGAHAIGESFRMIRRGECDAVICGGAEATVTPMGMAGFASMKALSTRNDEPQRASRPFDRGRDGFVMGEGAGILILESLEHAQARGAKILAEVVGYGMSSDAFHLTQPSESADGVVRVMKNALKDAGIEPHEVGYLNAHGTSTPFNDKLESLAVRKVFGDHANTLKISSTKSMTGHLLGAAGALEACIVALTLRDQQIAPTVNYEDPDPECDLDYTPNKACPAEVTYALSNSFGFGGTNVSLAFRRAE